MLPIASDPKSLVQFYLLKHWKEVSCALFWTFDTFKDFQLKPPDPTTRGSAPGPRWGLRSQTPVIGLCYRVRHGPPSSPKPLRQICPWCLLDIKLRKLGTQILSTHRGAHLTLGDVNWAHTNTEHTQRCSLDINTW